MRLAHGDRRATILRWDASDFKSVTSLQDGRLESGREIVAKIESRVRDLLEQAGCLAEPQPVGR